MNNYGSTSNYNNSGYGRRNNYRKRAGPYKQLTNTDRHTNPIYPKPELKSVDSMANGLAYDAANFNFYPITSGGAVVCLNEIGQGTALGQYIGNQVSIKSLSIRYSIILNQDTPAATSGRVIFLWDKQPEGVEPAVLDVLTSANYLSYLNMNNRDRFVVLRNDEFSLSPEGDQTILVERHVKINMRATYPNPVTNPTTPQYPRTGALLLLYIADQAAASEPAIRGLFRVRYYDN